MKAGYFSALVEPLRNGTFRALWLATIVSNIGTLMHGVGAAWLMTSMTTSPFLVGLVPAAVFLPTFVAGLWGGVLADLFPRRRILLCTQSAMMLTALAMGVLTLAGAMSPSLLLVLTLCLGLASSLNLPAWQSQIQDIVPAGQVAAAVSLNSMSFNSARAVGPALGGLIVAVAGAAAVFLLNAASFLGTVFVLANWKPPETRRREGNFLAAMREGFGYVFRAQEMRPPLLRTGLLGLGASAVWAVLPLLARDELHLGPGGYGTLLGAFGLGSLLVGSLVPGLRRVVHPDRIVGVAVLVLGVMIFLLATVRSYPVLLGGLFVGGFAWVAAMVQFNVAVQTSVPAGLRGRAMSFYIVCFQGSMGIGSAFHGWLAGRIGITGALLVASGVVLSGLGIGWFFPLSGSGTGVAAGAEEAG